MKKKQKIRRRGEVIIRHVNVVVCVIADIMFRLCTKHFVVVAFFQCLFLQNQEFNGMRLIKRRLSAFMLKINGWF